jgi:hypothetical protein
VIERIAVVLAPDGLSTRLRSIRKLRLDILIAEKFADCGLLIVACFAAQWPIRPLKYGYELGGFKVTPKICPARHLQTRIAPD